MRYTPIIDPIAAKRIIIGSRSRNRGRKSKKKQSSTTNDYILLLVVLQLVVLLVVEPLRLTVVDVNFEIDAVRFLFPFVSQWVDRSQERMLLPARACREYPAERRDWRHPRGEGRGSRPAAREPRRGERLARRGPASSRLQR